MEEIEKFSPSGNGTKDPNKGTNHEKKKGRDTAEAAEDESQERVEKDNTFFRACDDREIEMNGLRKFSKNLKFEKLTAEDMAPVRATGATRELAIRLKAGGEVEESRQREPSGS